MLKLIPLSARDSFLFAANEPCRVEVRLVDGRLHALVYEGSRVNPEQEPVGGFDGSIFNREWRVG
jgi:hypothetical protein